MTYPSWVIPGNSHEFPPLQPTKNQRFTPIWPESDRSTGIGVHRSLSSGIRLLGAPGEAVMAMRKPPELCQAGQWCEE